MNRKQFLILLVLVAVIGGAALLSYNKKGASYQGGSRVGQKLLGDFDINEVAHIVIKQSDKELNLVRGNSGWTVKERGDYPANFEQISEFIRKASELKVVQTLKVGPSQLPKLELAEAGDSTKSGTQVQLKGAGDKPMKSLRLGAKHMKKSESPSPYGDEGGFPDGRYVLPEGSQNVVLISDALTQAEPKPEQWLNKDFFKVEKVRAIEMISPEKTNSWKVSRPLETGDFKLTGPKPGENVDTNKLSGLANAVSNPSFSDVVVNKAPAETGLDKPTVVKIETFDKLTYTLKIGKKTADENHYVDIAISADLPKERTPGKDEKKEDKEKLDKEFKEKNDKLEEKLKQEKAFEKWSYLIPKWTLESLLKNRSELMVEKKDEKKDDKASAKAGPGQLDSLLP